MCIAGVLAYCWLAGVGKLLRQNQLFVARNPEAINLTSKLYLNFPLTLKQIARCERRARIDLCRVRFYLAWLHLCEW